MRSRSLIAVAAAVAALVPPFSLDHVPMTSGPAPRGTREMRVLRSGIRLNRSRRWAYASTYAEARLLSPYPNRPVR